MKFLVLYGNNFIAWNCVRNVQCILCVAEYYVAVYPYQSVEAGDLSFSQGEVMLVTKKEGDWWTGVIADRSGIFPSNYVQKADTQVYITLKCLIFF